MVLCIMHIYAHILAVEDDEAGRRGFGKLRAPYLCKCLRIRVAPCATFFTDLSPSKLTSLESAPNLARILYVIGGKKGATKGEGRGKDKVNEETEKPQNSDRQKYRVEKWKIALPDLFGIFVFCGWC